MGYAGEHEAFPTVGDDDQLWRYMDLPKLLSLLTTSSLWLARADLLGDPHEGSVGSFNEQMRPEVYAGSPLVEQLETLSQARRSFVGRTYINCWHENEHESMAMWSAYAASGAGVAVRTTFSRLVDSLTGNQQIHAGRVTYVDPSQEWIPEGNFFAAFMHKRISFSHEREVRLVTWLIDDAADSGLRTPGPAGLSVGVDIATLIEAVHVGPGQPTWFADTVRSVVASLHPNLVVQQSALDADPIY